MTAEDNKKTMKNQEKKKKIQQELQIIKNKFKKQQFLQIKFIIIFYYIYSFRYFLIYYKSDTDEKNNVNNTNDEKNKNKEINNENKNVNETAKNESDDNEDFETATKY